jgi:hypothetical protein
MTRSSFALVAVLALLALGAAPTQSCDALPRPPGPDPDGTYCFDGRIDPGEECDLLNLGGKTCASIDPSKPSGTPICGGCKLTNRGCKATQNLCGNGRIDPGEACDGTNLGGVTCARFVTEPGTTPAGSVRCLPSCQLDARDCRDPTYSIPGKCGNGILETDESCDGLAVEQRSCADIENFAGYYGEGPVGCNADCINFDTSQCISLNELHCGNGIVEPQFGEVCEINSGAGPSCTTHGFWSGNLTCLACQWDTVECRGCLVGGRGGIFCQ